MYVPEHFQENDQQSLFKIIDNIQAASLVTQHTSGMMATFLPLFLERDEGIQGCLYGHIAKSNPHWKKPLQSTEALTIFTGPSAYISPTWYPSKKIHHKVVPTWDHVTVHVHGAIEFFDNRESLLSTLTKLTHINEQHRDCPWKIEDAPQAYIDAMLKAIIGVKISITKIEGQRKLSQNKSSADKEGIIHGLAQSHKDSDRAVSALIKDEL